MKQFKNEGNVTWKASKNKLNSALLGMWSVGYIAPSSSSPFENDYTCLPEFPTWTHFKINTGKGEFAILRS